MRTLTFVAVAAGAALAVALTAAPTLAQGRGPGMPRYDVATERTVSGTVEHVMTQQGRQGNQGMHLELKTETGPLTVHVGPTRWLDAQKYDIAEGDTLTITGSLVTMGGQDALIAKTIDKGSRRFTLRNAEGFPLWSGKGATN